MSIEKLTTIDWAFHFVEVKIPVIPLKPKSNEPLIEWEEYQNRLPFEQDLEDWFGDTDNNIAIVTGKFSGLSVVEIGNQQGLDFLKSINSTKGPRVKTPNGWQIYFKHVDGLSNLFITIRHPEIRIISEGGYVVIPPSILADGAYLWEVYLHEADTVKPPSIFIFSSDDKKNLYQLDVEDNEPSGNDSLCLDKLQVSQGVTSDDGPAAEIELAPIDNSDPQPSEIVEVEAVQEGIHVVENEAGANSERDQEMSDRPVLHKHALYSLAGEFVEAACAHSEADPAAVLMTLLVRFAADVGATPIHNIGDRPHSPRLFAAIVGATGDARKGTSAAPVRKLFNYKHVFNENTPVIPARETPGPLSTGEGLINAVRDFKHIMKDGKKVITDQGVVDKRLFVLAEEFGFTLACITRKGNTLSNVIRSAWDDGNLAPLTKNDNIQCTNAHICIVAHITIEELKDMLGKKEIFNGFANRFLWVFAQRTKYIAFPKMIPESELHMMQRHLIDKVLMARNLKEIGFSENAMSMYEEIYPRLSSGDSGLVGVITRRAAPMVKRLALIYCLLGGDKVIKGEHLQAALAMWDYCEQSAKYIFGNKKEKSKEDLLIQALQEHGAMTKTQISNLYYNSLSAVQKNEMIEKLIAEGKIKVRYETSLGAKKPTHVYELV